MTLIKGNPGTEVSANDLHLQHQAHPIPLRLAQKRLFQPVPGLQVAVR